MSGPNEKKGYIEPKAAARAAAEIRAQGGLMVKNLTGQMVPAQKPRFMNAKEAARDQTRLRLAKLDPDWILATSRTVQDRVIALPEFKKAAVVGCYISLPSEVQTGAIIAACRKAGKKVCVPASRPKKKDYAMCWYNAGETTIVGPWGIAEPRNREFASSEIDLMIVPCLAFDPHGRRLGHGGGHFDRLLAGLSSTNICLAFEVQKLTAAPYDEHDVDVDIVVTEKTVYRPA
jgi:5-formyltetrahydrofolate cyclo-ligase